MTAFLFGIKRPDGRRSVQEYPAMPGEPGGFDPDMLRYERKDEFVAWAAAAARVWRGQWAKDLGVEDEFVEAQKLMLGALGAEGYEQMLAEEVAAGHSEGAARMRDVAFGAKE